MNHSSLLPWAAVACMAAAPCTLHAGTAAPGQVWVLVSQGGSGLRGLSILLDGADIASTDASGAASLSLSVGEHRLRLMRGTTLLAETSIDLKAGDAAEWKVEVSAQGAPHSSLDVFSAADPGSGVLSGEVTDDLGNPVAGAALSVAGTDVHGVTDSSGHFTLKLPRGVWDLSVSHPDKSLTRSFNAQRVSPQLDNSVHLALTERRAAPTGAGIEEVVATARYVPDTSTALERSSDSVLDAISAQDIAIAGDSDAAAALTRVTGVTIINDLVFVRGLGDRYSATYVNLAEVPSPDPSRRAIGLDLFPTDILGSISVQKTYSAELPGEFSGGAVLLTTQAIPDAFKASIGASLGGNSRSTTLDGLSYEGGDQDWLGRDDGFRDIPAPARALTGGGRIPLNTLDAQSLEQVGDALRPVFDVEIEEMGPDTGLEFTLGNRYTGWAPAELGAQLTGIYDTKTRFRDEERLNLGPTPDGTPLILQFEDRERTEQSAETGGIAALSAKAGEDHQLSYTGILSRQTRQETLFAASLTTEFASSAGNDDHSYTLDWIENQLISQQLQGSHRFPALMNLSLGWQATQARATSDTLDRREYRYRRTSEDDPYRLVLAPGPRRSWEFLEDGAADAGLDLTLPLQLRGGAELELKTGVRRTDRAREFNKVTWAYSLASNVPQDLQIALQNSSAEFVLDPRFIRPDAWQLRNAVTQVPGASNADSYVASQDLSAYYLQSDLFLLSGALQIQLGARREDSRIEVGLADGVMSEGDLSSQLDDANWMPAANLSWMLDERRTLRAGYSRTVNRPQFREIAPIPYRDPETRDQSFGNRDLEQARLANYDLRYEHYWTGTEGITVAAFLKDIDRPIEVNVGADGVGNPFITFVNARSAQIYGLELDGRWEMDELAGLSTLLGDTYLAGNLSIIESSVEIADRPGEDRPLQGQSPWIVNLTLGYSNVLSETDVALLFNLFGKRSVAVGQVIGDSRLPDAEEQPAPLLDLNVRQRLQDRWKLGFKLRNLLDSEIEVDQGGLSTRRYRTGTSAALSVEYEF